jgi:hypothetical protein
MTINGGSTVNQENTKELRTHPTHTLSDLQESGYSDPLRGPMKCRVGWQDTSGLLGPDGCRRFDGHRLR